MYPGSLSVTTPEELRRRRRRCCSVINGDPVSRYRRQTDLSPVRPIYRGTGDGRRLIRHGPSGDGDQLGGSGRLGRTTSPCLWPATSLENRSDAGQVVLAGSGLGWSGVAAPVKRYWMEEAL